MFLPCLFTESLHYRFISDLTGIFTRSDRKILKDHFILAIASINASTEAVIMSTFAANP